MDNNNAPQKSTRAIIWTIIIVLVVVAAIFAVLVSTGVLTINHSSPAAPTISHSVSMPKQVATPSAQAKLSQCQSELVAQAKASAGSIATNTILVVFTPTTSYSAAQNILASLGASSTAVVMPSVYARNHLIQASVLSTDEILDICTLRATSTVHYAGFDQLFSLHP